MSSLHIDETLKITEIFYSLQGESSSVGWPTVFVRLTGCPLRCVYCDSAYAFHGGRRQPIEDILSVVDGYGAKHVTVTGGEPLAQPACIPLLSQLCDRGYSVSIETSGALDIAPIDSRVRVVMDLKTPDSGECKANRYENIPLLKEQDEVKYVLASRADYDWAVDNMRQYELEKMCDVLFSVSYGVLESATLADWIIADKLQVRFQHQLHKLLWGDQAGR